MNNIRLLKVIALIYYSELSCDEFINRMMFIGSLDISESLLLRIYALNLDRKKCLVGFTTFQRLSVVPKGLKVTYLVEYMVAYAMK